ncbi:MAG: ABC transporter ATP-binding protein [Anaerolineae bacterium]|nr:ABC transporter ATP-binding protein [Anaerolineae bacterium]
MITQWLYQKDSGNGSNNNDNAQNEPEVLINLHDVVKKYYTAAGDFTALQKINLQVNPGEYLAVVGKSGSGKSTLINMITGIDKPTAGEVIVGGVDVPTLSEGKTAEWRGRNVGVIFQFFQLLPTLTVLENVMLPMDFCNMYNMGQRRERAMRLLDQVGLADHADKLPSAVSGGQQQRVAIARSLANDPPLIVADEPTGNLDSETSDTIYQLFEDQVAEGKTFLIVSHDPDLSKRVERIITLKDGQIIHKPPSAVGEGPA